MSRTDRWPPATLLTHSFRTSGPLISIFLLYICPKCVCICVCLCECVHARTCSRCVQECS